jgi:hypothetical protein
MREHAANIVIADNKWRDGWDGEDRCETPAMTSMSADRARRLHIVRVS